MDNALRYAGLIGKYVEATAVRTGTRYPGIVTKVEDVWIDGMPGTEWGALIEITLSSGAVLKLTGAYEWRFLVKEYK